MSKSPKNSKKLFVDGAISATFIADSIAKHSTKTDIGAHQIFLGQIRADLKNGQRVKSIDFTAYREMCEEQYFIIREDLFALYNLSCIHVYHSLGEITVGQINLFIFVSSAHRRDAIEACSELVERIKKELPIWGKELFEDGQHDWKVNNHG
jgi:molybdopterin synthase catalytic subunit